MLLVYQGLAYCRSDAWEAKLEIVSAAVKEDRTLRAVSMLIGN